MSTWIDIVAIISMAILSVSALGLVVLIATYRFEEHRRAERYDSYIEDLYSARCPDDLSNIYNRPEDKP